MFKPADTHHSYKTIRSFKRIRKRANLVWTVYEQLIETTPPMMMQTSGTWDQKRCISFVRVF